MRNGTAPFAVPVRRAPRKQRTQRCSFGRDEEVLRKRRALATCQWRNRSGNLIRPFHRGDAETRSKAQRRVPKNRVEEWNGTIAVPVRRAPRKQRTQRRSCRREDGLS